MPLPLSDSVPFGEYLPTIAKKQEATHLRRVWYHQYVGNAKIHSGAPQSSVDRAIAVEIASQVA